MKSLQTISLIVFLVGFLACKADTKKPVFLQEEDKNPAISKTSIKVALLLDTSNSMDGLIDQAKAQLWEIVNELSYAKCKHEQPNLKIALYEYGNDNLSEKNGYIRKVLGFTEDLDDVSKELFSLTTKGGSEYCGTVIKASLDQLDWGNNADDLKLIFIAGNEPFTQGKIDYRDAANVAKEKSIVVNTIFCGDYKHGEDTSWKEGAILTYGDYMAINHNQQTVHVPSPYDDTILQLNIKLNKTYIPYGRYGKEKVAEQEAQDDNAAGYSKSNAVSRTVSKSSHFYKNSSWDLVDAEKEENFNYSTLKKEQLPQNLQGKTIEEIKAYVKSQRKKREVIQKEIDDLNKKRKDYISNHKKENTNGLENAMIEAIKNQAKKKDYTWE